MGARGAQILALLASAACALALAAALAPGAPARSSAHRRAAARRTCLARPHARRHAPRRSAAHTPPSVHASHPGPSSVCRPARHAAHGPAGPLTAPGAPAAGSGASGGSGGSSATRPAGAGGSAPAPGEGTHTTPPSIPHIQVTAIEYRFTLSRTTVPHGKVIFEFVNNGQDEHNLNVLPGEGPAAGTFANTPAKGVVDQEVELRAGTYTLFCSLPEHEQKGMKGTLVVE
jgi:plastocyanin